MRGLGLYPRVIQVIEVGEMRGKGVEGDPIRMVKVYCTLDGEKLAEGPDPCSTDASDPPPLG